ncbi:sensor histidine kinase [Arcobacter sp. YIC-310]|uniref:sensor histidine kinase n=1 Tax=Arcobacter sp. YIC-310 TaxID=3376632 RepID=UPI003C1DC7C8
MKNYEKKYLLTTTFLFFIPLIIFSSIVLYMYHQDRINYIKENILYQMKDYTFDFQGDKFSLDIVEYTNKKETFKLYDCKEGLCAYFKTPSKNPYLLKVIYDKNKYQKVYDDFLIKIFKFSIVIFIFILLISIIFAMYSIRPMKEAVNLLETFLKDLIHDLNTPATSILLNTKLLRRKGDFKEIERIELSAKTISSLYKNLEFINPKQIIKDEEISIKELVDNKIELLEKLYPRVSFEKEQNDLTIKSNKNAVDRIIDNLLTNACKYNKKNGKVIITIKDNSLIIEDTGVGIKNVNKVFQRYYKENENGLGIGMSIVRKLCDLLEITIDIKSQVSVGTKISLLFPK